MTLRARLIAGFVAVALLLLVGSTAVTIVQGSYLRGQIDSRLESLSPYAGRLIVRITAANDKGSASVLAEEVSDYYVGRVGPAGQLRTVLTPASAPDVVPLLPSTARLDSPFNVATEGGGSRYRVVETRLGDGSIGVLGTSLASVNASIRRLVITEAIVSAIVLAVMGLVVFWVVRLGLRPIRRMTDAADAITGGATDARVEVGDGATEAARLGRALNTMIDANQASEERLRQFVADASHELRTPLTTLRGYASLHDSGGLTTPAEIDDAMRRIGQEATRMGRIVDDLLLLARLDEHGAPAPECVDVGEVVRDIASDLAVVQPERPVVVDCGDGLAVMIDRDHFVQAVSVLTTNVLRHTDPTVELVVRARPVDGRVRVEVSDRGPGIDPADLPHVFDRFHRSDRARSRSSGGNGLGLAIFSSIVSSNGGRFGVESTVGLGSTFWFELNSAPSP